MIKDDIKKLTNSNDILQYWAALLFAEITEAMNIKAEYSPESILRIIQIKVDEFPWHVQQEAIKLSEKLSNQQTEKIKELEKRISTLEKKVR